MEVELLFNINEIIDQVVPIYDKYYSQEDLVQLIQFYKGPLGRKSLQVSPQIAKETMDVTIQYLQQKIQK